MDKSVKVKCFVSDKIVIRIYKDDERKKDFIIFVFLGFKNVRCIKLSVL